MLRRVSKKNAHETANSRRNSRNMLRIIRLFLISFGLLQQSVVRGQQLPAAAPVEITHVSIVNVEDGSIQRDMTVLIRDGRIVSIASTGAIMSAAAPQIDGRGKFLIPGLWDMHVHLSWTTGSALPVFLANGVTSVRDCGSDLAEIDEWRTKIAGVLAGPRIIRAGPILNGQSFNRYQLLTGNPDQARGIVRALKQVGVDFIKVHRRVPRDSYFAIVDEARKQGLALVGHIPMTVTPEEASDAGQLIEHTETLFEGTFTTEHAKEPLHEAIRRFRAASADKLFSRFVKNHTPVTPTLAAWFYVVNHPGKSWLDDPRMRYVAQSRKEEAKRAPDFSVPEFADLKLTVAEFREVVRQMNRAGVTLLAGTDTAGNRIPGFLLHEELAALVDAGLTPLQALQAATLNPVRILRKENDLGSVQVGKLADLVLLDANPLEDIHNTQRINAVVTGGKLLRRGDLDSLLRTGEDMASKN